MTRAYFYLGQTAQWLAECSYNRSAFVTPINAVYNRFQGGRKVGL